MEFVDEAVEKRGKDNGNDGDKDEAAKQRVDARENFPGVGIQISQGAHAGEDHRSIRESIRPRHLLQDVVAEHANEEGDCGDASTQQDAAAHPANERFAR